MTNPGRGLPDDTSRYARPGRPDTEPDPRPGESQPGKAVPERGPAADLAPAAGPKALDRARRPALALVLHVAGPAAALAAIATIALLAVVTIFQEHRSLAVNSWLLTIGGLVIWACLRALTESLPTSQSSAFDSVRRHTPEPQARLGEVIAIEGVILDAEWSWNSVEHRLRPLMRKLAAERLLERRQVDMESEPDAARTILGDELWALVRPGPYEPEAHQIGAHGRGISRATVGQAVKVLEEL